MNASLVILLLFLSTCHGKEQGDSSPSRFLPTTKRQTKVETPLEVSCPDPNDIEPCWCATSDMVIDCSNVQDEEQLRKVFSAFFPTTEFYAFVMHKNYGVKALEDSVFGNVSFQFLDIMECILETLEIDALTPSLSRLTHILIQFCMFETFPFERLTEFTSLHQLFLSGNKIHTLPPLSSSSLQYVGVSHNLITHVRPDVFTLLPDVEKIYLNDNHLTKIPKRTFTGLPKLQYVVLSNNNISYLQSLTFNLVFSPSRSTALELNDNNIEYVEEDAFKGVAGSVNISMANNALTRLPEQVWRPVLENSIRVELSGNELACGCDVAWLVREPQLLTLATGARCADGTLLTDLNPADFDIFVCG